MSVRTLLALLASARGLVRRGFAWAVAELAARARSLCQGSRRATSSRRSAATRSRSNRERRVAASRPATRRPRACAQCGSPRTVRDQRARARRGRSVAAGARRRARRSARSRRSVARAPRPRLRAPRRCCAVPTRVPVLRGGRLLQRASRHARGGGGQPAGGAPRHRRAFSFLLFLTPAGFDAARDEGALRLYAPIAPAEQRRRAAIELSAVGAGTLLDGSAARDIPPEPGTLVVFRSEAVPHEALPTRAPRHVLVGWLHRPLVDPP